MRNRTPTSFVPEASVLIVEPDGTSARRMTAALGVPGARQVPARRAQDGAALGAGETCAVIASLGELLAHDLSAVRLVICALYLPDGSGLEALDFLRVRHPHVPVILVGDRDDTAVAVEAIRAGAVDFLTAGHDLQALPLIVEKCLAHQRVRDENERLHRHLGESLGELAVRNQQLQALVRQLEAIARTDDLTGLCNRRWLNELLQLALAHTACGRQRLAFLMIDLDDFKAVNDRLGHLRGDDLLRETGRIIQSSCRQADVSARYGGDEFCVLMPDCDFDEAVLVARRMLRGCEQASPGEGRLTMSIGIACLNAGDRATPDELVRSADEALYTAKAAGKGRIVVSNGSTALVD